MKQPDSTPPASSGSVTTAASSTTTQGQIVKCEFGPDEFRRPAELVMRAAANDQPSLAIGQLADNCESRPELTLSFLQTGDLAVVAQ